MMAAVAWAVRCSETALPNYRLPGNVRPSHYNLEIITDLDAFSFQGTVEIKLKCIEATDSIYLHSQDLDILNVKFTHADIPDLSSNVPVIAAVSDTPNDFIIVKLAESVVPGETYILNIAFAGTLKDDLAGYYRSSYLDRTTNTTKWLAVTQMEAKDARKAFPCFDEPAMKAKFTIKLAHKKGLKSISNMPLVHSTPFEGRPNWVWDEFQETVPMSTYLVAYVISDFEYKSSEPLPNQPLFRVWARRDALDQVDFSLKMGPKFLSYFEKYFDVNYPLPKQDMVAIPDFSAGAMENWGLITYRETAILYDKNVSSQASLQYISETVAHELAHQWFGNLVTMKWFTDIWLNEGFATYVATLGVDHEFPEWEIRDDSAMENTLKVFDLDALISSHPISIPIGHPNDIKQVYDPISYKKGSVLLQMMSLFLGEETFRLGVSSYLKKHKYGNAEQDDLWAALTDTAHELNTLSRDMTVKQIMDTWTVKTGYPVIFVNRDYKLGTVTVSQQRYLSGKANKEPKIEGCWWVPLTYSTSSHPYFNDTRPRHWLSCGQQLSVETEAAAQDWIIFNNRLAGLYHVSYDEQNWRLLAETLNNADYNKIDVLNRVQLLVDCLDLAREGYLDYSLAFGLVGYLQQEREYLPWKAAIGRLSQIDSMMKRTSSYGAFQKNMQKLLQPIYKRVGYMPDELGSFKDVKLQNLIQTWAFHFSVGDSAKLASDLFHQWRKTHDTFNPIPKDMRSTVYCKGIQEGGEEVWEFMWNKYLNSNLQVERTSILNALGCTTKDWLLNRLLEWSIDESSGIRRQDSPYLFFYIAQTDLGYFLCKQFFTRNINKIHTLYGAHSTKMGVYIAALAHEIIHLDELEELKMLTEKHKDLLKESHLTVRQSIESAEARVAWVHDYSKTIAEIKL